MRPLPHPAIEDVKVESVFHALSDPSRLAIFIDILNSECSHNCVSYLEVMGRPVAKSTLSLQFKALREAGLIRGERRGSEIHHLSRAAELRVQFPGLIEAIVTAHAVQSKRDARKSRSHSAPQTGRLQEASRPSPKAKDSAKLLRRQRP
jgi:DNA-binding transcriptional ArsR family regulator